MEKEGLCGFIFKSDSPSSGMIRVKVYSEKGMPRKVGVGMFARVFMDHFPRIPVEDDGRLHNPAIRENFIERIFSLKRWRDIAAKSPRIGKLVDFHSRNKLLLLSHSQKHYRLMGKLVANGKKLTPKKLFDQYEQLLLEALAAVPETGAAADSIRSPAPSEFDEPAERAETVRDFPVSLGLVFVGLGFVVMIAASIAAGSGVKVSPMWLVATYFLHVVGEMCLSPVGLSTVTKLAPERATSLMMGVWFLASAVGNYLGGRAASLYQTLHPSVLLAIRQVIDEAHRLGKPVSVCGEMAGDPAAALALLGLGIDSLSMNASNLPRVKWVIRSFTAAEARELVERACSMEDPVAIRKLYNSVLEQGGLGGLVRAGN